MDAVSAPVPGPSSSTRPAFQTSAASVIRRASAGDDGTTAPMVFRFRMYSLKKAAADMTRFAQANTLTHNGREQFSSITRFHHMAAVRLIATVVFVLGIASCSSPMYSITLKDGRQLISKGKPELQTKTGYYQYENLHGRDALVRADEVLIIEQQ